MKILGCTIVPIKGVELVNGEKPKTYGDVLPEIFISKQLSLLQNGYHGCKTDGFIQLHNALITVGIFPKTLIESLNTYDRINESQNNCPSFKRNQKYMILEYSHGGHGIEKFEFANAKETFLILQVAHILAVGERAFCFEHRDLHWGNVLVEKTTSPQITYTLNNLTIAVPSAGIEARIIDFTMARMINEQNTPIFLDWNDEELFLGTGEHQFNIYRMMKDLTRNQWDAFHPKTNIFWLHHLAEKLLFEVSYKDKDSSVHQKFWKAQFQLKDLIMEYESCEQFIFSPLCDELKEL